MSTKLERIVTFSPAFDRRSTDPSKNYGIGSVLMKCVLKGDAGATQFILGTGWHLPHVAAELFAKGGSEPRGYDVGYHSPRPLYEGQTVIEEECEYLGGKPCYYDGSSLAADRLFAAFIREGDEAIWKELEHYYTERLLGGNGA